MMYNFTKNLIKNENNSYSLNIFLPKKYNKLNYKIYNSCNLIQSGYFQNCSIQKSITIDIDKLETIFVIMSSNNKEYFELIDLKNLYIKVLENIKVNFTKQSFINNSLNQNNDEIISEKNLNFSFINKMGNDEEDDEEDDEDDYLEEDDDNDDDDNDDDDDDDDDNNDNDHDDNNDDDNNDDDNNDDDNNDDDNNDDDDDDNENKLLLNISE